MRALLIASIGVALFAPAAPAGAAHQPTPGEARAIEKAFEKLRDDEATIDRIRVSSEDEGYAAVAYEVEVGPPGSAARRAEPMRAPIPELFKKKGGKWKPVPISKAPGKVKKDLKAKGETKIAIGGDVVAFLHQRASCTDSPGFYSAGVYDKLGDVYLSLEFPSYRGPGPYDALGIHSVASLAVGTGGTSYQYETGQGNDVLAPSGFMHVDEGGWGLIDAGMAKVPDSTTYPISVSVSGWWVCG